MIPAVNTGCGGCGCCDDPDACDEVLDSFDRADTTLPASLGTADTGEVWDYDFGNEAGHIITNNIACVDTGYSSAAQSFIDISSVRPVPATSLWQVSIDWVAPPILTINADDQTVFLLGAQALYDNYTAADAIYGYIQYLNDTTFVVGIAQQGGPSGVFPTKFWPASGPAVAVTVTVVMDPVTASAYILVNGLLCDEIHGCDPAGFTNIYGSVFSDTSFDTPESFDNFEATCLTTIPTYTDYPPGPE